MSKNPAYTAGKKIDLQESDMNRVTISVENLNKLLNVVASLPYSQVAQVLQEAQQDIQPVKTEENKEG